jgi:hypothetical protein
MNPIAQYLNESALDEAKAKASSYGMVTPAPDALKLLRKTPQNRWKAALTKMGKRLGKGVKVHVSVSDDHVSVTFKHIEGDGPGARSLAATFLGPVVRVDPEEREHPIRKWSVGTYWALADVKGKQEAKQKGKGRLITRQELAKYGEDINPIAAFLAEDEALTERVDHIFKVTTNLSGDKLKRALGRVFQGGWQRIDDDHVAASKFGTIGKARGVTVKDTGKPISRDELIKISMKRQGLKEGFWNSGPTINPKEAHEIKFGPSPLRQKDMWVLYVLRAGKRVALKGMPDKAALLKWAKDQGLKKGKNLTVR